MQVIAIFISIDFIIFWTMDKTYYICILLNGIIT